MYFVFAEGERTGSAPPPVTFTETGAHLRVGLGVGLKGINRHRDLSDSFLPALDDRLDGLENVCRIVACSALFADSGGNISQKEIFSACLARHVDNLFHYVSVTEFTSFAVPESHLRFTFHRFGLSA